MDDHRTNDIIHKIMLSLCKVQTTIAAQRQKSLVIINISLRITIISISVYKKYIRT